MAVSPLRAAFPLFFTFIFISGLLILSILNDIYKYPILFNEGGLIESLSALGYFLCIAYMGYKWGLPGIKKYHYFIILFSLFGFRELDFDKKFTTMGIFKSKFYVSEGIPLVEKIFGLLILLILIYALAKIFSNYIRPMKVKIINSLLIYYGAFSTFLFLILSKSMDGIGRKLGEIGIFLDEAMINNLAVIEEVLELGIPMLIMSTLMIASKKL